MGETPERPGERFALLDRLKNSYLSSSLTILSIIQGVALAALGAAVTANYPRYTLVQWIMAVVTFSVLIVVWNQITIDTMTWIQVPDFQGALVPFLVGALELSLVAAIGIGLTLWLFGAAVLVAFSSVGLAYVSWLAAREPENAPLLARVRSMRANAHVYNVIGIVLFVLLGVGTLAGWLAPLDVAVGIPGAGAGLAAFLPGLWLAGWLWRSYWYWRKIVAYARAGS